MMLQIIENPVPRLQAMDFPTDHLPQAVASGHPIISPKRKQTAVFLNSRSDLLLMTSKLNEAA